MNLFSIGSLTPNGSILGEVGSFATFSLKNVISTVAFIPEGLLVIFQEVVGC